MRKIRISFKHKVLIPTIILFIVSLLIISVNNYRLLEDTVRTKTNASLDIFTHNVFVQLNHTEVLLDAVKDSLNQKNLASARLIAYMLESGQLDTGAESLQRIAKMMGMVELNIADANGVLRYSNIPELIGFDYNSTETTRKYVDLVDGIVATITEDPRTSVSDNSEYGVTSHYAGIARSDEKGFIQIGFDVTNIAGLTAQINIQEVIKGIKIENNGYGVVLLNGVIVAHPNADKVGQDVANDAWFKAVATGSGFTWVHIDDASYYAGYKNTDGYTAMGLVPEAEYRRELSQVLRNTVVFLSFALVIMTVVMYIIMNNLLKPIKKVTAGLGEIANGNFDARVDGNYNDEFALIKEAVNEMAQSITLYLHDKLEAERLAHEVELERLDLLVKVHHDSLTCVYNRRYLDENLNRVIRSLSRTESDLSVLMIDIDFFKGYNDTYGHNEGDMCLRRVSNALTSVAAREDDFVARYGGEEFVMVLPNTNGSGAQLVADKLLRVVRELSIEHIASEAAEYVTVSIGATTGTTQYTQSGETYIKRADEALYESKRNGRNQYTFLAL